jgi:dynein assembly factor with WDR repeat domains 1
LDFNFNAIGTSLVTASVDMTMRVYNVSTFACTSVLEGHEGEVSKAVFNPQGTKILSASFDHTARLWDAESGKLLQTL